MFKIIFIFAILVGVEWVESHSHQSLCDSSQWLKFKEKFRKTYVDSREDEARATIFCENVRFIDAENRKLGQEQLFVNGLSDLSNAEFRARLLKPVNINAIIQSTGTFNETFIGKQIDLINEDKLPEFVDWSLDPGIVGPVFNQGHCGSCWAFTIAGLIEGQQHKRFPGQRVIPLSAQQLVACDYENLGCNGGTFPLAIAYIRRAGGVESVWDYPYTSFYGFPKPSCIFNETRIQDSTRNLGRMAFLQPGLGDEQYLKRFLASYGPIAIMIQAGDVLHHAGHRIIYDKTCEDTCIPNHAVLLVGYGTTPKGEDYWIIKNSWGSDWGVGGYGFLARNRDNHCGVATLPTVLLQKKEPSQEVINLV